MSKKIALFHPWLKSRGGAERVVLKLLENSKHKIDLYTWAYNEKETFDEFKKHNVHVICPKIFRKIAKMKMLRGLFLPLSLLGKIPLENYDLFLISTAGVGEFVLFRNYKKGATYAYVHTPLREASEKIIKWNLENGDRGFLGKGVYLLLTKIYKFFEKISWKRINVAIFNSELSRSRAEEHNLIYRKQTYVIYPPVDFLKSRKPKGPNEKNFIYVSRINPPKRQDLVIRAWKEFVEKNPDHNLLIIGHSESPNYLKKLQKLSDKTKNVRIITNTTDDTLKKLIGSCEAGLFFGYQEDFGIVPLEIIGAGKPLIAVDEGGYFKPISKSRLFYKVKEMRKNELMVEEIRKGLEDFVKRKRFIGKDIKINTGDFVKQIDKILDN